MRKAVIILEGLISSGKTTLARELGEALDALVLLEPDEKEGANPYLARYYEDPNRWALTMQLHLLGKRFEMHSLAQWHALQGQGHVVMDRSYYGDTAFAHLQLERGTMTPEEFETYCTLYRAMTAHVMYPTVCVHLQVDPEVANLRKAARMRKETGRQCEACIPLDYLQGLDREIRLMVGTLEHQGVKVIPLDWNDDKASPEARAKAIQDLATTIRDLASRAENPLLDRHHRRLI